MIRKVKAIKDMHGYLLPAPRCRVSGYHISNLHFMLNEFFSIFSSFVNVFKKKIKSNI